jgi:NAD(P)-dependent dehydrogenase (short-subunit alcohol dehydrogenase family)
LCEALVQAGASVHAVCRSSSAALDALRPSVDVIDGVDLRAAGWESRLDSSLGEGGLDLVIPNAGTLRPSTLEDLGVEGIREQFEVNALAALRVLAAVAPRLRNGAKVAIISSLAGSIGDNQAGGAYGYRMSKAALNMAGVSLARDLAPRGVAVAVFHPGRMQTNVRAGGPGMPVSAEVAEPREVARTLLARLDELTVQTTARFTTRQGTPIPW